MNETFWEAPVPFIPNIPHNPESPPLSTQFFQDFQDPAALSDAFWDELLASPLALYQPQPADCDSFDAFNDFGDFMDVIPEPAPEYLAWNASEQDFFSAEWSPFPSDENRETLDSWFLCDF